MPSHWYVDTPPVCLLAPLLNLTMCSHVCICVCSMCGGGGVCVCVLSNKREIVGGMSGGEEERKFIFIVFTLKLTLNVFKHVNEVPTMCTLTSN